MGSSDPFKTDRGDSIRGNIKSLMLRTQLSYQVDFSSKRAFYYWALGIGIFLLVLKSDKTQPRQQKSTH